MIGCAPRRNIILTKNRKSISYTLPWTKWSLYLKSFRAFFFLSFPHTLYSKGPWVTLPNSHCILSCDWQHSYQHLSIVLYCRTQHVFPLWKNYIMSQEVSFLQQNQRICSVKSLQTRKEDRLILEQLFKVHTLAAESLFHSPVPANSSMQHVPNVFSPVKWTRPEQRIEFVLVCWAFLYIKCNCFSYWPLLRSSDKTVWFLLGQML